MSGVNLITSPPHFRDSLETRFNQEWNRTEQALRINNLIQWSIIGAAFIVNGLAILVAFHVAPVAAGGLFTLMLLVNAAMLRWYTRVAEKMRINRARINSGIFEELLIAPNENGHRLISPEKIAIFRKYGHQCRSLRISTVMYPERGNYGHYVYMGASIKVSLFCDWAINLISEGAKISQADPYDPNHCKIQLLEGIKKLHGSSEIVLGGFGAGEIIEKIYEYGLKLQFLKKGQEGEGSIIAQYVTERKEKIKKELEILQKTIEEMFKSQVPERFDVHALHEVIKLCPKLETLEVSQEYEIKDLFEECESQREKECHRHHRFTLSNGSRSISICALKTLGQKLKIQYERLIK